MQKLARADLSLGDRALVVKLGQVTVAEVELADAEEPIRDVAYLKELEAQVRAGGLAQYFFGFTAKHAFELWFATQNTTDDLYDIITRAIARVTFEFGDRIELDTIFDESDGKDIPEAYRRYIAVMVKATTQEGDPVARFDAFKERVSPRLKEWDGLEALTLEYYNKVSMNAILAKIIRENADLFVE